MESGTDKSTSATAEVSSASTAPAPAVNAPDRSAAAPTHNDAARAAKIHKNWWKQQRKKGRLGPTGALDEPPQLAEGNVAEELALVHGAKESAEYVAEERRQLAEDHVVEESPELAERPVDENLQISTIGVSDSRESEVDHAKEDLVLLARTAEQDALIRNSADAAMENESAATAEHTFTFAAHAVDDGEDTTAVMAFEASDDTVTQLDATASHRGASETSLEWSAADSSFWPPAHHVDALAALPAVHVNPELPTTLPWTMKNTFLFEGNPREVWYMYDRHTLRRRSRSAERLLEVKLMHPGEPMYVTPMMERPGER